MFITQMEYREKSTATNWKRMQFPQHANLAAEDPALATRLLDHIAALVVFGRNENTHQFINAISRITLKAAHLEFMWFAKSTVQDGQFLVDEEELYAQDNTMLMRRAFAALTTADDQEKEIPVTESMLAQNIGSTVLDKLQNSLQRVQYYKPTDGTAVHIQQQILTADHGTLVLIDGSNLSAPLDLSPVTARRDIQVLGSHCTGLTELHLSQKGNMISCK